MDSGRYAAKLVQPVVVLTLLLTNRVDPANRLFPLDVHAGRVADQEHHGTRDNPSGVASVPYGSEGWGFESLRAR